MIVRHALGDAPFQRHPKLTSSGWLIGTTTGSLVLCGAGYLIRWAPNDPRSVPVQIPSGWYEVEIRGYLPEQSDADVDGVVEFVLTPATTQPPFRALLTQSFSLLA